MQSLVILLATAGICALPALAAALWLREGRLRAFKPIKWIRSRSTAERLLLAFIVAGLVRYGVTKQAHILPSQDSRFRLEAVVSNEPWDFTAPADATIAEKWRLRGAAHDTFSLLPSGWTFALGDSLVSNLIVHSDGQATLPDNVAISPFPATLGIVPEMNWPLLADSDAPSLFWHSIASDGSLLLTWWNVLLERNSANPLSIQAELKPSGSVTFRYDLSRLASDAIVADISPHAGGAFPNVPLSREVTSISFKSRNECTCDERRKAFDSILGGLDPFSCPEGSTNTVLEHTFYSGSANGPFEYPKSSESKAILRVVVSGTGTGELLVGDSFVPLAGAPQANGGEQAQGTTLLLPVKKGTTVPLYLRGDKTLSVSLDSDDFAFGSLPSLAANRHAGRINFPDTKATEPCIHDYSTRQTTASLPASEDADMLTCTWQSVSNTNVENIPPRSAKITGLFPARGTGNVTYTLSHPDYLFGRTTFSQVARFCPQPPDHEDESDPDWHDGGDEHTEGGDLHWNCTWGICKDDCPCKCHYVAEPVDVGDDFDDTCVVHGTPYKECAQLHVAAYTNAVESMERLAKVLYIREPPVVGDSIFLEVPTEHIQCCPCPDHWTNSVRVAFESHRLRVTDGGGAPFDVAYTSCTVNVSGVQPSRSVGDAGLSFSRNGVLYRKRGYTVLGVAIKSGGVPLERYNELDPTFGFPMSVCTNAASAPGLNLVANVKLPDGDFHLELADATGLFAVWYYNTNTQRYHKLLDTESMPAKDISMPYWRGLMRRAAHNTDTALPIRITSSAPGSVRLVFRYWNAVSNKLVSDTTEQLITSIDPPLLIDYNRDGTIDDKDVNSWLGGELAYFWINDDKWDGDDAFTKDFLRNSFDSVVNGRCDLINFLPIAVNVAKFTSHWGADSVQYRIETTAKELKEVKFAFADIDWTKIGDAPLGTDHDIDGNPLHEAPVSKLSDGTDLPQAFLSLSDYGRSTLFMEFPEVAQYRNLELNVYSKPDHSLLFSTPINMYVSESSRMIIWLNLRAAAKGSDGVPTRLSAPDWPKSAHKPGNVVFVHGYNMAEDAEAPLWALNVFKKLWWAGLDRGFIAVQWTGNEGQLYEPLIAGFITPNYYGNVQNAFRTAPALADAMKDMQGPKWFIAHSLGNMLVSAAIHDCEMEYEKYFMLNAAVALEAFYPTTGITPESHDNMTPQAWTDYADKVRATHWFECFPESDGRRLLTWKGRFSRVTKVVNFYSTQEEVVANGDGILKPFGRDYSWFNQEVRKGDWPTMMHANEGGWEFNPFYDIIDSGWIGDLYSEHRHRMKPASASELTNEQLQQHPFFLDFINPEMHSSPNGIIVETNDLYRAEMLAYAIPSESYAVGANPLPGKETVEYKDREKAKDGNYDMALLFDFGRDDLPKNGKKPENMHRNWQHSTFVQRSYKRVHQLFKVIVKHIKAYADE